VNKGVDRLSKGKNALGILYMEFFDQFSLVNGNSSPKANDIPVGSNSVLIIEQYFIG
jgi:hypothetical protein